MAYTIKNHEDVQNKARRHLNDGRVVRLSATVWSVRSAESGVAYVVNTVRRTCTCDRQEFIGVRNGGQNFCSHQMAAEMARTAVDEERTIKFRDAGEDFSHLHRRTIEHGDNVQATTRTDGAVERVQSTVQSQADLDDLNALLFG